MKIIQQKREDIVPYLFEWAETFNPENIIYNKNNIEEMNEIEMFNSYQNVINLAFRLENNQCSKKDFEDILFHIEQINYNEIKIFL
jgi:hypothetical protein